MVCTPSERFELPRSRKIIKADAYASALRMRVCARTQDFVLHHLAHSTHSPLLAQISAQTSIRPVSENWAQLGLVVPKRLAKHSVRRNLLKRLIREGFRLQASQLPAGLWVVRLNNNVNKTPIMALQKKLWAAQLKDLWIAGHAFSEQLRAGKVIAAQRHSKAPTDVSVKQE